jgi:hypothetical protein
MYHQKALAFGPLPNLLLRNKPYNQHQIIDALNEIIYDSDDSMWNERHKTFVKEISRKSRWLLKYHTNVSKTLGGMGHILP